MELTPNCIYEVHHSSGTIRWKYTSTVTHEAYRSPSSYFVGRSTKRYHGINLGTGREVVLKSTAKIRRELESTHGTEAGRGNYL